MHPRISIRGSIHPSVHLFVHPSDCLSNVYLMIISIHPWWPVRNVFSKNPRKKKLFFTADTNRMKRRIPRDHFTPSHTNTCTHTHTRTRSQRAHDDEGKRKTVTHTMMRDSENHETFLPPLPTLPPPLPPQQWHINFHGNLLSLNWTWLATATTTTTAATTTSSNLTKVSFS